MDMRTTKILAAAFALAAGSGIAGRDHRDGLARREPVSEPEHRERLAPGQPQ